MKNRFSFLFFFFIADHLLVGQLCTNPKSDRSFLSCLKVTLFNERDRRCAAVQFMLSTDPSYDNRTIKMQIRTVQRLRAQLNASDDPLEVVERKPKAEDTARKTRTKEFIEKVQTIIRETLQRCGGPLVQSGGRWQTLGVAAGLVTGPQVQRDPGLASEGVLRLCTLLSLAPSPQPEPAWLLRLVIRREHHQHDLPQHQSQPDRRHPPSSRQPLWKRQAPSSGSVSRRWMRLKAATLNRCQLYYIIKLPELIFSIKVLK